MDPADISSFFSNGRAPSGDPDPSPATEPEEEPGRREIRKPALEPSTERNGFLRGGAGPGFINGPKENQVSLVDKVIDAVTKRLAGSDLKQVINDRVVDPAFELLLQRSIPYLVVAGIAYFVLILLLIGIFIILIKHSKALKRISEALPLKDALTASSSS